MNEAAAAPSTILRMVPLPRFAGEDARGTSSALFVQLRLPERIELIWSPRSPIPGGAWTPGWNIFPNMSMPACIIGGRPLAPGAPEGAASPAPGCGAAGWPPPNIPL